MGMLWYGFNTTKERNDLHYNFQSKIGANLTTLQGIEITSILLNENTLDVNPGVLGCGILIGNLSETSYCFFKEVALDVINIYQDSTMFDRYSGKLKFEEFDIKI